MNIAQRVGERTAWEQRTNIYLASAAMAEFIADLFLCPLEAVRIRSVSDPTFPKGLGPGMARMLSTDGILGFYAGLGPILFKQSTSSPSSSLFVSLKVSSVPVPYTMAKFAVQGKAAELIYSSMNTSPDKCSKGTNVSISLASGVVAGVMAAIVSHPADTLLSKINKKGAGGEGSTTKRLLNIAREMGVVKLCTTGLGARCVMIGTLTAGALRPQFSFYSGAHSWRCRPVRYLRHHHEPRWCPEVPFPQPRRALSVVRVRPLACVPVVLTQVSKNIVYSLFTASLCSPPT